MFWRILVPFKFVPMSPTVQLKAVSMLSTSQLVGQQQVHYCEILTSDLSMHSPTHPEYLDQSVLYCMFQVIYYLLL